MTRSKYTPNTKYDWESGPMRLIPTPISQTGAKDQYTYVASERALVHNCIIRALNSIYLQAPHIPLTDYKSFISYCLACYEGLEARHDGKADFMFPELETLTGEKGLMDANVQQREAFHTGFKTWGNWLRNVAAGKNNFSPDMCLSLMDDFVGPLSEHLANEILTLLSLSHFGDSLDLKALAKAEEEKFMAGLSKTTQLPLFLLNHDVTYEGGIHNFPPIPAPVMWALRNVFGRWNADWWKFAACGFDGRPRGLRFVRG